MLTSWPNDWKTKSLTLDEARDELARIATQIRGALVGLRLCYQAKSGYVREVEFARLDVLPDAKDEPVLGLITVNTQPGALPPRISIDRLCSDRVLKHLSSVVHRPVYRWNSTGLTYAVLFRPPPQKVHLPRHAPLSLDERPRGRYKLGIGLSRRGAEWYGLEKLNHLMVAGETDAGKSTFLRSLVYQVLHWERPVTLYLSDRVGATFAPVAGVPQLGAPIARTVEETLEIGKKLSGEMERRDQLFLDAPDYPEKLSEYHRVADDALPLVVWIIDEAPAFLALSGGRRGVLARLWTDVAQQSRKYGIYLVLASHDWCAETLPPPLKGAMKTRVVFRQADSTTRHIVLGKRSGPERIGADLKGRAWCLLPGAYREVQTYWVAKRQLIERCEELRTGPRQLSAPERTLVRFAWEQLGGYFVLGQPETGSGLAPVYHVLGSRYKVGRLAAYWQGRGLLTPELRNEQGHPLGRLVTPRLLELAGIEVGEEEMRRLASGGQPTGDENTPEGGEDEKPIGEPGGPD